MKNDKFYTLLSAANKSAAHFQVKRKQLMEEKQSSTEIISNAFRALVDGTFNSTYVVMPEFGNCTNKDNKARRDSWLAANTHLTAIKNDDYSTLQAMHSVANSFVKSSDLERVILPAFTSNGVTAPIQPIMATKDRSKLYYFTAVSNIEAYIKMMPYYGIQYRTVLQLLAARAIGYQLSLADIVLVAVEKEAPHEISLIEFPASMQQAIISNTENALQNICQYSANNDSTMPAIKRYIVAEDCCGVL
jgi:hypothetical protein